MILRKSGCTPSPFLFRCVLIASLAWLAAGGAHAEVRLVDTAPDIVELLAPYLPDEEINDAADALRVQRKLGPELNEILATEGYFEPKLNFEPQGKILRLTVDAGPRTRIRNVDIVIEGDLLPERRQQLLDSWPLQQGMPFRQADWNRAKQAMLSQLLAADFRGASLSDSRAEIDVPAQAADLKLVYKAGLAYRFGPLQIRGLERYDSELIDRYNYFVKPGDHYSETALASLQAALQGSGYFASVQISTVAEEAYADENGQLLLPVHLRLRERAPHRVSFGAGASSNTGARVEAVYSTTDLAWQAWKLNTGVRLEERKQTLYADIFLPPAHGRYLPSLGMAIEKSDIANLQTERRAFSIQRAQKRGSVDSKYSLNWEQEDKQPWGGTATKSQALVPDTQWTWHRLDSILNPRDGQALQVRLGIASKAALSDQDFVRSYARYQHYLPVGERDTLGLRAEVGYTFASSKSGIPETYLFRAGGTNSVRGYSYNSLGVRDGEAVVGGRYMTTASVEYTHWFDGDWGVALFVDAGNAVDDLADARLKYGAGSGARWRSPAGPIALDLAWGEESNTPRLHFSLAIPF